ncbi:pilus assembly protein TadG-related protein, partial [Tessaracoccus oleiagri]
MKSRRHRERGAIAVWTAVGLLGFLLAIGIGVDFSGHARATQEARAVAAEAARAGGQRITLTGGRAAPAQQAAASAAERFAARSGFHATATVNGTRI